VHPSHISPRHKGSTTPEPTTRTVLQESAIDEGLAAAQIARRCLPSPSRRAASIGVSMRAFCVAVLGLGFLPPALGAQASSTAQVTVSVVDQTGAVVPNATVTLVGLEAATKTRIVAPVKSGNRGIAVFEAVVPGRYSITAEFQGFDAGLLRNVTLRAGDNKHAVILPLRSVETSVTVRQDNRDAAIDPRGPAFGTALSREQIEALSDDPGEMAAQLEALAGGGTIRINSFEGGELPPKSMIQSVHITRDAFAAENHSAGMTFVDVITRPGSGPLRVNTSLGLQDGSMSGRSPFVERKGPEQNRSINGSLSRTIIPDRASFTANFGQSFSYATPIVNVVLPTGTVSETLDIRSPRRNVNFGASLDFIISRNHQMRVSYSGGRNSSDNLGIGGYALLERGYSSTGSNGSLRIAESGPVGRRMFLNTRMDFYWSRNESEAHLQAPTIIVTDAVTRGGAQVGGSRRAHDLRILSDLDYVRGLHSLRAGVDLWGTWYRSDQVSNHLGTYTFANVADFEAGRPTFYTRRIGDPLIEYLEAWLGAYVQDDIRLSKAFTLSLGVRYEGQSHVRDSTAIGPRVGFNWAPFASGRTTVRASWGMFYDWLSAATFEQAMRVDGFRQRELQIVNPTYPVGDETLGGVVPRVNRYLLDHTIQMARNQRVSVGIDQTITPRLRGSVSVSVIRAGGILRGVNLNAPFGGLRPDPEFGTVIMAVDEGRQDSRAMNASASFSVLPQGAPNAQARFNWRRMSFNASYALGSVRSDSAGAFAAPATGTFDTEWGPSAGDVRHRMSGGFSTTAVRNLSANFTWSAASGVPYTLMTGRDDNGDLIFNDRPDGVGRNTLRYPWNWNVSGSFSYSLSFGRGVVGSPTVSSTGVVTQPASAPRYRVSVNVRVSNLTNRHNYSGFSGVMTSPFFLKPTSVSDVRRINFSTSVSF
jgi:hypothetical protein